MFDIFDFIDSKDIREYNRNTNFSPIEKAVLVYFSRRRTVEEKLSALKELLENYSDEEFSEIRIGKNNLRAENKKQIVEDLVETWERALALRYKLNNVVFAVRFYEAEYPKNEENGYYSNYNKAFEALQNLKQYYLDDDSLKDIRTKAEIRIYSVDSDYESELIIFYFDSNLRMIDIDSAFRKEGETIEDVYVYVSLPFKAGDILRTINNEPMEYGTLRYNQDENEEFRIHDSMGDSSDMQTVLDVLWKEDEKLIVGYNHYRWLDLEYCPLDELPKEQNMLRLLSEVYKGKRPAGSLLEDFSKYGERAWDYYLD